MSVFSATTFGQFAKSVLRWRAIEGANCILGEQGPHGRRLSANVSGDWEHPWQVHCRAVPSDADPRIIEWRATVRPGFINGRDVTIDGLPLTDEDAPSLVLSWRNPLASAGPVATEEGDIGALPGEGYPPYFERLGVKAPAPDTTKPLPDVDPARTREIRACDIALITPRIATRSGVEVGNAVADGQSITISTVLLNDYARAAASQYRLIATPKWVEPMEPSVLDRMSGTAVEPQTDEIRIATVFLVSPPGTPPESEPDATWSAYPQHAVFWNLFHASRNAQPAAPLPPFRLITGLALGVADGLFQGLLTPINDAFTAIQAFFSASDYKGKFWSC